MSFTHIDAAGNAIMVDVGGKEATARLAVAEGTITMSPECFAALRDGRAKKGDVLGVAQVAGIMAAKKTPELIPMCHGLNMTNCRVEFELIKERSAVLARCTTACTGVTGVEMEALTGVSVALLTVYDMCKAMDKSMEIGGIHLVEKQGGKSGHYLREERHDR